MKTVLVIGASGNMGAPLCPLLVEKGYEVHAIVGEIVKKKTPGVTYHLLDAMNDDVLKAFLAQGFDAVVDFMTYRNADVLKKRLPMLLGSAGQYVLFSSYRVYADGAKLATETSPRLSDALPQDDPWRHRTGYAQAKCVMEDLLHAGTQKNWTVLRPTSVYSQKRIPLVTWTKTEVVDRAYAGRKILLPREVMPVKANIVRDADAAKMIAGIVLNESALGEIYNVCSTENPTWNEILDFYRSEIGLEAEFCGEKEFPQIVYGANLPKGKEAWLAEKLNWWENIYTYGRIYDMDVDNTKILKAAGLKKEDLTPIREGLSLALKGAIPGVYRNMDRYLETLGK